MTLTGDKNGRMTFNNKQNNRELSKAEIIVAHSLRGLLKQTAVGASFEETEDYRLLMVSFDYFIPEVLGELYPEWKSDALDDLIPLVAKRSGEREAILFGLSWLIRDQTVVPTYLQLQIAPPTGEFFRQTALSTAGPGRSDRLGLSCDFW